MLASQKYFHKLYYALYMLIIFLLIIPWAYFEPHGSFGPGYSFLPRQIIFILMAAVGFILVINRSYGLKQICCRKIFKAAIFFGLGFANIKLRRNLEPHYFYEFIYLELALLIIFAPLEVRKNILKYSSWVFYAVIVKAFFLRMGNYIHGGFFSSNLFATYIVYLTFVEIYRKRYWNIIPAVFILYFIGSKASYISILTIMILAAVSHAPLFVKIKVWFVSSKLQKMNNFYSSMAISALLIYIFTLVALKTDSYKIWSEKMAPSIVETTKNNMIMYGLDHSKEYETEKGRLLNIVEDQFKDNPISLKPLITDVNMSIGLRVLQYNHMYSNLDKYFWWGDTEGSQAKMMGHNPHSAMIDFISRLSFLYLILILIFYSKLFKFMNLFLLNVSIIPILAFQPYGFTIGHSIVILTYIYVLCKTAKEQEQLKI